MNEIIIWGGARLSKATIETYPDTMPLIRWNGESVDAMLLRNGSLTEFVATMFFVDSLLARGYRAPRLVLPFIPGARQDRLNGSGDFFFTAKSIAGMLNARNFPSVTVLDPHSDVAPALIDRCRVVSAADCIFVPDGKYDAVVSPDAGAEKRSGKVARKLGVPLIHAWKTRDVKTGAINGFGMEVPPLPHGALALVVDDICDGGGTFLGLADVLDDHELEAHLWVTHGLFTQGTEKLLGRYSHVYCTDSVDGPRDGIIEIEVCEKLLKGEAL